MPVNIASACEQLHAEYTRLLDQLSNLPTAGSISEEGRSISASASEITARMELLEKRAAALGCPIGRMNEPFVITSRTASR